MKADDDLAVPLERFVKLTEDNRRERQRRIDAGPGGTEEEWRVVTCKNGREKNGREYRYKGPYGGGWVVYIYIYVYIYIDLSTYLFQYFDR